MSEAPVQNEVQREDKCFVCFQSNNKVSIPIPCLNNHPDKIHKKCYEEYSKRFPNCFCGNKMHIPKHQHETMVDYWNRCCGVNSNDSLKIVRGVVRFKNLLDHEEVTKPFTATVNSIKAFPQYIDKNKSFWQQISRGIPYLINIESNNGSFWFVEHSSILCIYRVDSI